MDEEQTAWFDRLVVCYKNTVIIIMKVHNNKKRHPYFTFYDIKILLYFEEFYNFSEE